MLNLYYTFQENCLSFEAIMSIFISCFFLILSFFYSPTFEDLKNSDNFFDCNSINITQFEFNQSRVLLKAKLNDFYQYPKSYAPLFLKMNLQTGNIGLNLNISHYYDILNDKENLSFCGLTSIGGNITADLYCNAQKIKTTSTYLNEISYYPIGTTKLLPSNSHLFDFSDACLTNEHFEIFQYNPINFPHFKFSVDKTFTPIVFGKNIHDYRLKTVSFDEPHLVIKKYDQFLVYDERFTIILPSESKFPFFNILLPILDDYNINPNISQPFMIYSTGNTDFIKNQLNFNDSIVSSGKRRCFLKGSFAKTIEGQSPFYENQEFSFFDYWINNPSLNKLSSFYNITYLKKAYQNNNNNKTNDNFEKSAKKIRIVFEDGIEEKVFLAKNELAQNQSIKIKNVSITMDAPKIARIMHNADVYVACSIPGLLLGGFLKKNSSIVKINPDNTGNNNFTHKIGQTLGLKTFSVPGSKDGCHDMKCIHESFSFEQTSDNDILKTIRQVLVLN